MENIVTIIKNVVSTNMVYILIAVLVIILILTYIMHCLKVKKAKTMFSEQTSRFTTLKNVPLSFKYNKAVALARVNEDVKRKLDDARDDFENTQEQIKECDVIYVEIDDLLYEKKAKSALNEMAKYEERLVACEEVVNKFSLFLDELLEQENAQRELINKLKEQFRNLKFEINNNMHSYPICEEFIEKRILKIEGMFSNFEEWMYASEFDKASQKQIEIKSNLKEFEIISRNLAVIYERSKGILPRALEEVSSFYMILKNDEAFLKHLNCEDKFKKISDDLNESLNKLSLGVIEGLIETLNECENEINIINNDLNEEDKAMKYINEHAHLLLEDIKKITIVAETNKKKYEEVCLKFGLKNMQETLNDIDQEMQLVLQSKVMFEDKLEAKETANSLLKEDYEELLKAYVLFKGNVENVRNTLNNACADEERARKQNVKLQLLINDINCKIKKYRLPVINDQYETDLEKSSEYIRKIRSYLEEQPLNVIELNATLNEAMEFIYTLFNNVNDLIGMANLVENAIVFGNRYRSSHPEIDSELTRAEVCYRHGQYTKALRITIKAIEKLHPGTYDKIVNGKVGV